LFRPGSRNGRPRSPAGSDNQSGNAQSVDLQRN
jgi:hypothetical protein